MKSLTLTSSLLTLAVGGGRCTAPHAELDSGPVFGSVANLPAAEHPVYKFLGIPYGAPPERFALPSPPEPWTKPLNATEFGPACIQYFVRNPLAPDLDLLEGIFNDNPPQSEDCLYINAFAPATPGPESGRPIVLFIHGGGWQQGHGRFDLSGLAAYEDIVAFAFNYRTAVFGFPNAPDIPLEERNLGLFDQRLAIEWVQKNAKAFGGDPTKVTIWGQSAGSMSVDAHLAAYANEDDDKPPFRAAILSSGQMSWGLLGSTPQPDAYASWNNLSRAMNCGEEASQTQLECMRTANATEIVEQMGALQLAFSPLRDNNLTLPSKTAARWRDGNVAKVPILTGTVAQEGRALVSRNISLEIFLGQYFPDPLVSKDQRELIVAYYRALPGIDSDFDLAAALLTDYQWQCPQNLLTQTSASLNNPTWRYYWNVSIDPLLPNEYDWLGKFHGSELLLLFSTPSYDDDRIPLPLSPQMYAVANSLWTAIARFVRNPHLGPGWPSVGDERFAPFDLANIGDLGGLPQGLAAGATPVNRTLVDERCALFEKLYPVLEEYVLQ